MSKYLNSISTHNFLKLSLLQAYITIHNFDVICLSDTYLGSSILHDDENLHIPGYLYTKDYPLNIKRGGVSSTTTQKYSLLAGMH